MRASLRLILCLCLIAGAACAAWLAALRAVAQDDPHSITLIAPDSTFTLRLDGASPSILAYQAEAGETIRVAARALGEGTVAGLDGTFVIDPVLELLAPDGRRLAYNDDAGDAGADAATDALIARVVLPEAGLYTLRVNTFNGVTRGEVEVTLTRVAPVEALAQDDGDITTIQVMLRAGAVYRHRFAGRAGQVYTFTARALDGLSDPMLALLDASGSRLAANDDHAGGDLKLNIFDARIADFAPPSDGGYTLELREFAGRAAHIELTIAGP